MYVCICNAVTEQDIKNLIRDGNTTMSHVCKQLGCALQCGKCVQHIKEVRNSVINDQQMDD